MSTDPREPLSLGEKAEIALKEAVRKVAEEARRTGSSVVVWREGAVAEIPASELPPAPSKSQ